MKRREVSISEFPMPDPTPIEGRLLNSIIVDSSFLSEVQRVVKSEFFSNTENRKVWDIVVDMHRKGEHIDMTTVFPKVDRKNYIDNIMNTETVFGQGVVELACVLAETYIKREAYNSAIRVLQGVETGERLEVVTSVFSDFGKDVADKLRNNGLVSTQNIANTLADNIMEGKMQRVGTPFSSLNYMTYGGLGSGNLIILAARPSVGKTTIGLQMAQNAARIGKKACFFSLEMTALEVAQRMIVGTGLVSTLEIVSGNVDWEKYEQAVSWACNKNLLVNDKSRTLEELCTQITIEAQAGNCDIAFIDYLGLISHDDRRKTYAQVIGDITGRLKSVAKECNIPVVLLCQLNRESAKEGRSPQLFDLRDSGAIEQDADMVLMLERPRDDMGTTIEDRIDLWVRKNRGGKTSTDAPIRLQGNENYSEFREITDTITIGDMPL